MSTSLAAGTSPHGWSRWRSCHRKGRCQETQQWRSLLPLHPRHDPAYAPNLGCGTCSLSGSLGLRANARWPAPVPAPEPPAPQPHWPWPRRRGGVGDTDASPTFSSIRDGLLLRCPPFSNFGFLWTVRLPIPFHGLTYPFKFSGWEGEGGHRHCQVELCSNMTRAWTQQL
jgi:hypothetical protein